jgi:hypothetical protein
MWAAYLAEREGMLGDRFGCVTPQEAAATHTIFRAGMDSMVEGRSTAVAVTAR